MAQNETITYSEPISGSENEIKINLPELEKKLAEKIGNSDDVKDYVDIMVMNIQSTVKSINNLMDDLLDINGYNPTDGGEINALDGTQEAKIYDIITSKLISAIDSVSSSDLDMFNSLEKSLNEIKTGVELAANGKEQGYYNEFKNILENMTKKSGSLLLYATYSGPKLNNVN